MRHFHCHFLLLNAKRLPLWQRLAAFFSLAALASALLAPSAMLAEEVRTGKLGGLCSSSRALAPASDVQTADSHCDFCGASGFALALAPSLGPLGFGGYFGPGQSAQLDHQPSQIALPPSRGPPVLLN